MTHARPRTILAALITPHFGVAVALLAVSAVLAGPMARWMNLKHAKLSLPLRAPLHTLNDGLLGPYRVVQRQVLPPEVVDALDTDQYLSWVLEDEGLPRRHPLRNAIVFVTYYTGGRNLVPHTPDVCFLGSGYEPAQAHENLVATVPSMGAAREIPIRVCTFVQTAVFKRGKHTVVYTFNCNGEFTATRSGVRLLINDPRKTYAYFSKVEVRFPAATREQSIQGADKLLNHLLPALVNDHWPDFETAEAEARKSSRDAA